MLNTTWEFELEPTAEQVSEIERTLSVCRKVWNFALAERKDWINFSLQADVDVPEAAYRGHSIGIDVGLAYFLSTSGGLQV